MRSATAATAAMLAIGSAGAFAAPAATAAPPSKVSYSHVSIQIGSPGRVNGDLVRVPVTYRARQHGIRDPHDSRSLTVELWLRQDVGKRGDVA